MNLLLEQKIDKIIEFAIMEYTKHFDHQISNYLFLKEKYKLSYDRILPHPIQYNVYDELAFQFVKKFSIFLSRVLSIDGNLSDTYIKNISSKIKISYFCPEKIIEEDESKIKKELENYSKGIINPEKIHSELLNINDMNMEEFELINIYAKLRARNYNINNFNLSIEKTMKFLGIIPTIITTAATITGISSLQLYSIIENKNNIDFIRECSFNLATNSFIMWKPRGPIKRKDVEYDPIFFFPEVNIPTNHTVWDKIIIDRSMTCQEFIDYFLEKYNVEISVIIAYDVTICCTVNPKYKIKENKKIEDLYNENSKNKLPKIKNYLLLDISGDKGDSIVNFPTIKYIFKN